MTAFLGAIVVSFSVGLGLGVGGTFYLLWKRGVFSFDAFEKALNEPLSDRAKEMLAKRAPWEK